MNAPIAILDGHQHVALASADGGSLPEGVPVTVLGRHPGDGDAVVAALAEPEPGVRGAVALACATRLAPSEPRLLDETS